MKVTHTTIYTADDGTEYTDARLCLAHDQVLAKGEHAYGTIEFEEARDALAAPLPVPAVALTSRESPLAALTAERDTARREAEQLQAAATGSVSAGGAMKLWLLRPVENLPEGDDPWEPWYDKAFGFVVRAETEDGARSLAQANAGDEKRNRRSSRQPWLDAKYSTCAELTAEGAAEMVIRDIQYA